MNNKKERSSVFLNKKEFSNIFYDYLNEIIRFIKIQDLKSEQFVLSLKDLFEEFMKNKHITLK